MKILFLLIALASVAGITAVAATAPEAGKSAAADNALPNEGLLAKPRAADAGSADVQLANSGKVLEVLDAGMYTYLQVTTEKGPLWLAAYKTDVAKGVTVRYSTGIVMAKFYSKSLGRTFDVIVFVDRLEVAK